MDDTLLSESTLQYQSALEGKALALGKLLDDHRGGDVVVMDMRALNFWTDFFIIATATSSTHLSGLERHIKEFVRGNDMEIYCRSGRPKVDADRSSADYGSTDHRSDEWQLLDLGGIVIHLMAAGTRSFYELERLWSAAPIIYGSGASTNHSSKSS